MIESEWKKRVVDPMRYALAVRVIEEPDNVFVVVHESDKLGEPGELCGSVS